LNDRKISRIFELSVRIRVLTQQVNCREAAPAGGKNESDEEMVNHKKQATQRMEANVTANPGEKSNTDWVSLSQQCFR
jgi:hypothetical protein